MSLAVETLILWLHFSCARESGPDHVFSDQLLKLEHNTLSVRDWSALPSRECILGCLDSLFKLFVCDDGHPGYNFLRGLHAHCRSVCFLNTQTPDIATYRILHIQPILGFRVPELSINEHLGGALQGQVVLD